MVLPTIVATTSVWVVALGGPIVVVAPSPADHIMIALRLVSIVEAIMHRGGLVGFGCLTRPWTNRGLSILSRRCHGQFRGAPAPSRGGAFGLLYRCGLEEVSEFAMDPSPLRGRWLGHCSE